MSELSNTVQANVIAVVKDKDGPIRSRGTGEYSIKSVATLIYVDVDFYSRLFLWDPSLGPTSYFKVKLFYRHEGFAPDVNKGQVLLLSDIKVN